jgi:hypothetical protein
MLYRQVSRQSSEGYLYFATIAALGAIVVVAIALALPSIGDTEPDRVSAEETCATESWPYGDCGSDAGNKRSIRLVSPDRIEKRRVYTSAAAIPIPPTPEPVEPIPPAQPVAAAESSGPGSTEHTDPEPPSIDEVRSVTPRARAQAPPRRKPRSVQRERTLGLGLAPQGKSYTGAGGGFDAVH